MKIVTKKILKRLKLPKPFSHKRDNGRLLIIAGSKKYFGALVYCVKTASRFADLIYILTTKNNQRLIEKIKLKTAEFMPTPTLPSPIGGGIEEEGFKKILNDIDAILIGPGLGISSATEKITSQVLKSGKKTVFDADALNVMDNKMKRLLSKNHILTPHTREFQKLFGLKATPENAQKMMKKHKCTIILKGPVDYIANINNGLWANKTGNAGMTKGGTGDVLAGLIAGLFATNDAFTAAAAGCYINGSAGDDLHKKFGTFYNAEDLMEQVPLTLHKLVKSN